MSNANSLNLTDSTEWEEICEWNIIADNEEAELAKHLTVRPVTSHGIGIFSPAIANDSGSSTDNNDDDDDDDDETYEYVETYSKATFANVLKSGLDSKQQVSTRHSKKENHVNRTLPTPVSSEEDEESTLDEKGKRGSTRRVNDQVFKIHDQRLYRKLVSRDEIELSFSPGDNNRNEEFVLLKAAKKAMKKKRRTKRDK